MEVPCHIILYFHLKNCSIFKSFELIKFQNFLFAISDSVYSMDQTLTTLLMNFSIHLRLVYFFMFRNLI